MKRTAYTQPQLSGLGGTVRFGGVVLTPLPSSKPYTGPNDLWAKYEQDGLDGPTLFDQGMDYDNREGRG
jgi:hypothetical protein